MTRPALSIAVFMTAVLVTILALLAGGASAGQTGGFAPYARQGIVSELNRIYGKGASPYRVSCTETDRVNYATGQIRDTVTCTITGPL